MVVESPSPSRHSPSPSSGDAESALEVHGHAEPPCSALAGELSLPVHASATPTSRPVAPLRVARGQEAVRRVRVRTGSRLRRALSDCARTAMLSVGASVAGRQLPVWNINVPANARLRQVLTGWAVTVLQLHERAIPPAAHVTGKSGRPSLDLDATLLALRPELPVKGGRLCLTVSWPEASPEEREQEQAAKKASAARSSVRASLGKLGISSRYTSVDRGAMGYHRSSTFLQKIQSGFYGHVGSWGVALPRGHGEFMKPCPSSGMCGDETVWPGVVQSRELVVYGRETAAGAQELLRVRLVGPEAQLANWAATVRRFEKQASTGVAPGTQLRKVPFPVFLPSRGRATRAHLNWEAPHVFGPPRPGAPAGTWPVLCIVVEPQEEAEYRQTWQRALMLVLPDGGKGPSYARWVVQVVCSRGREWKSGLRRGGEDAGVCGPPRLLPWCWICDDNLLNFFRLVGIPKKTAGGRPAVHKRREWDSGAPLFWEAMVTVQQHPSLLRVAVAGFLRDDGTATCKKRDWKTDELSLYKIVLLNNRELRRLGAEYLPGLRVFEDIYLNTEVRRLGGLTLKCQSYCFREAPRRGPRAGGPRRRPGLREAGARAAGCCPRAPTLGPAPGTPEQSEAAAEAAAAQGAGAAAGAARTSWHCRQGGNACVTRQRRRRGRARQKLRGQRQ
mmetsp:Transcript_24228/g.76499  ORF Transcript_24228/g.76499 Transcript_24228/m.76499 type:complete len:674 (-) Transcript_24228:195-2216(-)